MNEVFSTLDIILSRYADHLDVTLSRLLMIISHNQAFQELRVVSISIPPELLLTDFVQLLQEIDSRFGPHNSIAECSHSFITEYFSHGFFFFPSFGMFSVYISSIISQASASDYI